MPLDRSGDRRHVARAQNGVLRLLLLLLTLQRLTRSRGGGSAAGLGVEAALDRLFLMLGTAAEHRIEPQPEEGCDHGQNDDFDGHALNFQSYARSRGSIIVTPDRQH
jgi:hypothetical protein